MTTRRRFLRNTAVVSAALAVAPQTRLVLAQAGSSTYRNPILGGDHPDASPIRVGASAVPPGLSSIFFQLTQD